MRLMTFRYAGQDHAGVLTSGSPVPGIVPILEINSKQDLHLPNSLLEIIRNNFQIERERVERTARVQINDPGRG